MTRDNAVGAALETLEVPEHGPDFWAGLTAAVESEPVPITTAPRRRWRRQALRATTVAAAVAVLATALAGGLGTDDGPLAPRPASAAEVVRRVNDALAAGETLRGTLVYRDRGEPGARTTFVATVTGDLRLETTTPAGEVNVIAYDAARGVEESYWLPGPGGGFASFGGVRTGLAPVQTPDAGPMDWVLGTHLYATMRAAAGDEPAAETTYDGRPAWLLSADVTPQESAGDLAYDSVTATIDRATALPVRIVESRHGATVREVTIEGLATGGAVERAAFDLDVPPGAKVTRTDEGFRRGTVEDALLVPSYVPEGYEVAAVAVAERGGHTGAEGLNPPSENVVSVLYRRGFARLLVTTRERTPGEWTDPMASGEGIPDAPEPVTLGGALAGARAELVANARGAAPHVWALTDDLVVTVSGDLTRAELLDVAGSLAT